MASVASQVINRKIGVEPVGSKDGVNLVFEAPEKFDPESLEVFLSGIFLDPDDYVVLPDNKTFQIVLEPLDGTKLNCPPQKGEPFRISYVQC